MSEQTCPRLIEVALPIREISAESVRDKSLRHGHISTLHLWWARRPLAASRAVVFASLVPDPDDLHCPKAFKEAVEKFLKKEVPSALQFYNRGKERKNDKDPYAPYEGIPDTLRNRLLCFIAKWSPEAIAFEKGERDNEPAPKELLDDRSLVKWETSDPKNVQGREVLKIARELIHIAYNGNTPTVLDPFSGGGAIPLEAGRLGCQAIANDYNPVAYLILRATCEFPQKYGKPGKRKVSAKSDLSLFQKPSKSHCEGPHPEAISSGRDCRAPLAMTAPETRDNEGEIEVSNVLVHDIEQWANWILARAKEKIGHLYPSGKDGKPIVGYLWARTAPCSNPSCKGKIPLLRNLLVCNKSAKRVALTMDVDKAAKKIQFGIAQGSKIKQTEGTMQNRGNVLCPYCNQITPVADLRIAGLNGTMSERLVTVITEGGSGKEYRAVEESDVKAFALALKIHAERPKELILPEINADDSEDDIANSTGIRVHLYGMKTWGSLFNQRQLVAMQTFVECLHEALKEMQKDIQEEEYRKAIGLYTGLIVSRASSFLASVCRWNSKTEIVQTPFSGQAIPMMWDYPEVNPLSDSTGSYRSQISNLLKVIKHEQTNIEHASSVLLGNAVRLPIENESSDCVVTDPPYYDAISYADLSDFFYIWLKRMIGTLFPNVFITPLTPKSEEATSLKHRHKGSYEKAQRHYEQCLLQSFSEAVRIMREPKIASIMFAHQSTAAWTALISAFFGAGLTPDATWPIATEKSTGVMGLNTASLETSVTVACRPRVVGSAASFKDVRKEIEKVVQASVKRFWGYGFRGADLIVACYGPAVGVFGKYERVEKADGTPVEIPELLEFARKAARDAIAGEFKGDNLSTLYYVWANLYGAAEQA